MRIVKILFISIAGVIGILATLSPNIPVADAQGFVSSIVVLKPETTVMKLTDKSQKILVSLGKKPTSSTGITLEAKYQDQNNTSATHGSATLSKKEFRFTPDNFSTTQELTLTVTGAPREKDTILITGGGRSSDGQSIYSANLPIVISNDDIVQKGRVTFVPSELSFSKGASVSVSLKLDPPPSSGENVTITTAPQGEAVASLSPTRFVFDSNNTSQKLDIIYSDSIVVREGSGLPFFGINFIGKSPKYDYSSFLSITVDSDEITRTVDSQECGLVRVDNCSLSDYIANQDGFVYKTWLVIRSAINILLVIALIAISFSNIARINIDTYTIKKALPNLLIGIVLANASMYIIRFLADVSTAVVYFFVGIAGDQSIQYLEFKDFLVAAIVSVTTQGLATIGAAVEVPIVAAILTFVAGIFFFILLLWLAFLLYFRLVTVYLLTIISPIAFIAYGLPGMDKYFKQWWQQFVKWLFMIVPMAAVFWLMIEVGRASSDNQSIASLLIQIVLFITAVTMPTKLGGAVMDKASKAFMKYTGAAASRDAIKDGVTDFARTKANQIGYRIPGVARTKGWLELAKKAADDDIGQLKKRGRAKAQTGSLGRNIQKLKHLDTEISDQEAEIIALKEDEAAKLSGGFFDRDNRNIGDRKLLAEFKKRKAEERTKSEAQEERFKFINSEDEEIKALIREVFKATIDQEVGTKEVARSEIMKKGAISTEYLQPVQAAMNYRELREQKAKALNEGDQETAEKIQEAMNKIDQSFIKMKGNKEYAEEFGKYDNLEKFLFEFKPTEEEENSAEYIKLTKDNPNHKAKMALLEGRQRQTARMFNEGVVAQIADDIKEQTVEQIDREMEAFMSEKLGGDIEKQKLFMKGDTATLYAQGISADDIRSGRVIMEKYKTIMKSTSDIRNKAGLQSFVKRNNDIFKDEVEYQFNADLVTDAGSNDIKDRRSASGHVMQHSGAASGLPYLINQNANPANSEGNEGPNTKYVSSKKSKEKAPTPPPTVPPKPNISSDYVSNNDLTSEDYDKQVEYDEAVRKRRAWEKQQQATGDWTEQQATDNEDEEESEVVEEPEVSEEPEEQE